MAQIRPIQLMSHDEILRGIGDRARRYRLDQFNWSQETLQQRSGVAVSTIKRFEKTGKITLDNLILIATAMQAANPLLQLFEMLPVESIAELEQRTRKRQRGTQ